MADVLVGGDDGRAGWLVQGQQCLCGEGGGVEEDFDGCESMAVETDGVEKLSFVVTERAEREGEGRLRRPMFGGQGAG